MVDEAPTDDAGPAEPLAGATRAAVRALAGWGLGLALVVAALGATRARREGEDLLRGKPWRASSSHAPCHPERLECGGARTAIFFHTAEEAQPWVEFDLGAPTTFSSAEVLNRRDGPKDVVDRAVPLVLEASDDRAQWREVARMEQPFAAWAPTFGPVTARYLRARSPRVTWLHLESLRLFR